MSRNWRLVVGALLVVAICMRLMAFATHSHKESDADASHGHVAQCGVCAMLKDQGDAPPVAIATIARMEPALSVCSHPAPAPESKPVLAYLSRGPPVA